MQEFILKNLISIIFIVLVIYGFVKGFKDGFLKKILSFGSLIVTIFLTRFLTPFFAEALKDITNIESTFTSMIYDVLINSNFYDKLNLTWLKDNINTGNIGSSIKEGICTNIANALINLICGIAVFILVLIVIKIILKVLDIVDFIPVVGQLNKLLGGVLGVAEIILIMWVVFTVLRVLENVPQIAVIVENIKSSVFVNVLYNNNVVYDFLSNLFSIFKK